MPKSLLTLEELAKVFKVAPGSIRNQLSRGTFPVKPLRIGRLLRFKSEDVQRFIDSGEANHA
jgi:predicted DNA-binding transcriptional regulator AlpA